MGGYNSSFSSPQFEQAITAALLQEKSSYNITQDKKQNYASLTEAIAAVSDEKYKVNGLVLTFYTGTEWVSKRYNGADASGFATEDNWVDAGAGKKEIAISESEPLPESTEDVYYQIEDIPDEEAVEYVTEAPADDNEYVRKNKGWVKSSGSGSSAEITKESVEAVLTGNIESHTHDTVYAPAETDVWDGVTVSESLLGTGTKEDPYQINSCADWVHYIRNGNLYKSLDEGAASDESKYVHMSINKNLDFNNHEIDRTNDLIPSLNGTISTYMDENASVFINIYGNNNIFKNVNVLNGNILPLCTSAYLSDLSIYGIQTYNINTFDDNYVKGKVDFLNSAIYLFHPTTIVPFNYSYIHFFICDNINLDIEVKMVLSKTVSKISLLKPFVFSFALLTPNTKSFKINSKYNFDEVIDDSKLRIIHITSILNSNQDYNYKNVVILDTTKFYNITNSGLIDPKRPSVSLYGCIEKGSDAAFYSDNFYILNSGDNEIDSALASFSLSKIKPESELKDPSFLNTLNSASGENIWITGEDGFPTLNMQQKGAIKYDGYVKQSEFDKLKKNPVFNEGVVYIPYDVFFNPEKTRDEASAILGGNDGLQNIIKEIENGKRLEILNADPVVGFTEIKTSIFEFNNIKGLNLKTTALTGFGMADMLILVYYESNGKFAVYKSSTNLEPAKYKGE